MKKILIVLLLTLSGCYPPSYYPVYYQPVYYPVVYYYPAPRKTTTIIQRKIYRNGTQVFKQTVPARERVWSE